MSHALNSASLATTPLPDPAAMQAGSKWREKHQHDMHTARVCFAHVIDPAGQSVSIDSEKAEGKERTKQKIIISNSVLLNFSFLVFEKRNHPQVRLQAGTRKCANKKGLAS